jgi:uncharacterized protein YbcC (UPF0753/DUF2309 family)
MLVSCIMIGMYILAEYSITYYIHIHIHITFYYVCKLLSVEVQLFKFITIYNSFTPRPSRAIFDRLSQKFLRKPETSFFGTTASRKSWGAGIDFINLLWL